MEMLTAVPEKGFYYHYKHDPNGSLENYAYEVIGVGHHTEEEGLNMVIYRPLYEGALVWKMGKLFDIRPLEMFMEEVTKDDKTFPRFWKITDSEIIAKLREIRDRMYGKGT